MLKQLKIKYCTTAAVVEPRREDLIKWLGKEFKQYLSEHIDMYKIKVSYISRKEEQQKIGKNFGNKHSLMLTIPYSAITHDIDADDVQKYKGKILVSRNNLYFFYHEVPDNADIDFKSPVKKLEEKEALRKK